MSQNNHVRIDAYVGKPLPQCVLFLAIDTRNGKSTGGGKITTLATGEWDCQVKSVSLSPIPNGLKGELVLLGTDKNGHPNGTTATVHVTEFGDPHLAEAGAVIKDASGKTLFETKQLSDPVNFPSTSHAAAHTTTQASVVEQPLLKGFVNLINHG